MQKWQYCFVTTLHELKGDEDHEPQPAEIVIGKWTMSPETIKDPDKGTLRRVLNDLGGEGWEVTGMSMSPFGDTLIILKRPMEGRV